MNTNRIFGRSRLAGMGWRTTASSRPGRFQTRGNASPESLSREAIFEHRPGGTLTQRPGKRPWTTWNTWLTRKLLWTLRTRRRGGERESEVEATKGACAGFPRRVSSFHQCPLMAQSGHSRRRQQVSLSTPSGHALCSPILSIPLCKHRPFGTLPPPSHGCARRIPAHVPLSLQRIVSVGGS